MVLMEVRILCMLQNCTNMEKIERSSNIELLRIIAMIMIVLYHCLTECITANPNNRILLSAYYLSHWGVPVFLLISGYFSVKLSFKKVFNFWMYCAIWMLISYLLSCTMGYHVIEVGTLIKCMLPFSNTNLWFVPFYFWLMLLSPMLNAGVKNLNTKELGIYTIVLLSATLYFSLVWKSPIVDAGHSIVYFITLYMTGAFLKRINGFYRLNFRRLAMGVFTMLLIVTMLTLIIPLSYQKLLKGLVFFYVSPILLLCAVIIFMLFLQINIKSRFVNNIAGSSFAIYLFHENGWSHAFFYGIVGKIINDFSGLEQFGLLLLFILGLCIAIIMVDKAIREPITKLVNKLC